MLDSNTPPTLAQCQTAKQNGHEAWGIYLSAPGHPQGYPVAAIQAVLTAGLRPVYIWVGNNGNQAVQAATAAGAKPGDALCIDVEAGGGTGAGAAAFASPVRAAGFSPWLYGTGATCSAYGDLYDVTWIANGPVPPGTHVVSQYQYDVDFDGVNVDVSLVGPSVFSKVNPMTPDMARGIIYSVRAALLGEDAGSPNEAAAIEAYVTGVVANPEGGLSSLIADCEKDPRYLPGRVAKLEETLLAIKDAA